MNGGNMATCPIFSWGRGSVYHSLVVDNSMGKERQKCTFCPYVLPDSHFGPYITTFSPYYEKRHLF